MSAFLDQFPFPQLISIGSDVLLLGKRAARPEHGGGIVGLSLLAGDRPCFADKEYTPEELRFWSAKQPGKPTEEYDSAAPYLKWSWTCTHWWKPVRDPSDLSGALLWSRPKWNGANIHSVRWPDFPQGGTLVRALFDGSMDSPLWDEASALYRAGRREEYARIWQRAEAEFVAFAKRYDPDNPVHRDSQTNILIPVDEIEKTLTPIPAEVLELIKRTPPEGAF